MSHYVYKIFLDHTTEINSFLDKVGKIKDYKVKFHVGTGLKSVIQKEWRISFALLDKVNEEIEQLEQVGIIEDVIYMQTYSLVELISHCSKRR